MKAQQSFEIQVNPIILNWARESLGLTRTDASQRLKITNDYLKKLENGKTLPTNDLLQKMAKKYHRPFIEFLSKEPPETEHLPKDFRTKVNLK